MRTPTPTFDASSDADPSARPPPNGPSSLLAKTGWSTLASASTTVTSALTVILVARVLGVSGSGEVAFGVWLASTVAQLALFALPQAAMRFLSTPADAAGVERWVRRRSLVLLLPGAVAGTVSSLASGRGFRVAIATGLLTVMAMLGAIGQALLAGRQRFRTMAVAAAASAVLLLGCTWIGCVTWGPTGGLVGSAAAQVPFILGLRATEADALPSPGVLRRLRSYCLESWIAATAALFAWSRLEFIFLQAQGSSAVALYSVALTVSQLGLQPTSLLGSALLPHFGELVGGRHYATARETLAATTRVFAFLAFPLCFGLAAAAPHLVPSVFGPGFSEATWPAIILVASASIVAIGPPASAMMYAHERTRFSAQVAIASAVAAALAFALVIPRHGPIGAAATRALIQGLGVATGFTYLALKLGARAPLSGIARAASAAALGALASFWLSSRMAPSLMGVAATAAAMTISYAILSALFRPLHAADVRQLEPLLRWLPRALRGPALAFLRSAAR